MPHPRGRCLALAGSGHSGPESVGSTRTAPGNQICSLQVKGSERTRALSITAEITRHSVNP